MYSERVSALKLISITKPFLCFRTDTFLKGLDTVFISFLYSRIEKNSSYQNIDISLLVVTKLSNENEGNTVNLLCVCACVCVCMCERVCLFLIVIVVAVAAAVAMYLGCFHVLGTSKNSFSFACVNIVRV